MAMFGRESERDKQRAERVRSWVHARSPYAVVAPLMAALALVDICTPIGLVLGPVSIVVGVLGLRDLRRRPELVGHRLCYAAIIGGAVASLLAAALWSWWLLRGG